MYDLTNLPPYIKILNIHIVAPRTKICIIILILSKALKLITKTVIDYTFITKLKQSYKYK